MALSPDRVRGIRKMLNTGGINPEADTGGIRDDIASAVWPEGTSLPSAAADKWEGRLFWHTVQSVLYVCDGTNWLPVGGTYEVPVGTFGSATTNYELDATGGASYVYRSGRRIDVRLRLRRKTGTVVHGEVAFQIASGFRPAGIGAWPLAGIQATSPNTESARAVGIVLNQAGGVQALTPTGNSNVIEFSGSYFLPAS